MPYDSYAWGNIQNFVNDFNQLMSNPVQFAMKHFGVSENIAKDPDAIIQQMMQSGKISQGQYNAARRAAMQIQNNPLFQQLVKH